MNYYVVKIGEYKKGNRTYNDTTVCADGFYIRKDSLYFYIKKSFFRKEIITVFSCGEWEILEKTTKSEAFIENL